jgi:hypothetical protein
MAVRARTRAGAGLAPLKVKVVPAGLDPATMEKLAQRVLADPSVQQQVKRGRYRLLSLEPLEPEETKRGRPAEPTRHRATIYDYAGNRALIVEGPIAGRGRLAVTESGHQPLPTREEFEAAVQLLANDPELGPALGDERTRPYPPMPPLIEAEADASAGRPERTVAVGLLPVRRGVKHEIVGVNLVRRTVVRFERGAPETALVAGNRRCGIPFTQQTTTGGSYVAGQALVTVSQGGRALWKFRVLRPAATKGPGRSTNGTGIELRYLDYRGKRVLYRAHAPILNVRYTADACGPYRDWQNEEGMIQAAGTNVAPGFRLCPTPAKTILDTGSDAGNFLGVGIYVQGQEVVLVSEMEAGWYRYVSEWRLHADGTIRPRFGFTAVENDCVCNVHYHHVYWRFDFDIRTPGNNVVREFNDPCLPAHCPSKWHTHDFEVKRARDPSRKRKWRVENSVTKEAYDVIPGPEDGIATASPDWPFPRGDVWILRYHPNEIDDGVVATGPPYAASFANVLNGEPVKNQDVVLWYAAHFTHDVAGEPPGEHGHIVGPTLKPVNWGSPQR